jgi:hypothetical protein
MIDAGQLTIETGTRVCITSTRPRTIGRSFMGRKPVEALALAPVLFAVCGAAQTEACARALTAAGADVPAGPGGRAVAAEAIREHLMRIAVDWARALGETTEGAMLKAIHRMPRAASDERSREAVRLVTQLVAAPAVLGEPGWHHGKDSIAARLIRRVIADGWSTLGGVDGVQEQETSALTLTGADTSGVSGNGLLARLLARPAHLRLLIAALDSEGAADGPVATARGLLHHRAELRDGVIASYEIIAPTDVNFAPGGPAERSLAACGVIAEAPARLLIEAFDPCIPYSMRAA